LDGQQVGGLPPGAKGDDSLGNVRGRGKRSGDGRWSCELTSNWPGAQIIVIDGGTGRDAVAAFTPLPVTVIAALTDVRNSAAAASGRRRA
jgi:hypothetical protein